MPIGNSPEVVSQRIGVEIDTSGKGGPRPETETEAFRPPPPLRGGEGTVD